MRKVLFISQRINDIASGARVVSRTNLRVMRNVLGMESVVEFSILKKKNGKLINILNKCRLLLDGLTASDVKSILRSITTDGYDTVYIDSSYFGILAKKISHLANVKIVVFYHDILVNWWKETHTSSPLSYLTNLLIYGSSERLCARYAHSSIVMTERDKKSLMSMYGVLESNILVIPMSMDFQKKPGIKPGKQPVLGKEIPSNYLLFVGVDYKPNVDGLRWFIKEVQSRIENTLVVVGKGMEKYTDEFKSDTVRVIGTVDELNPWYENADACIMPIFSGTGMKVKTAEALAYGKPLFATDESLVGYDVMNVPGIFRCNTGEEFVTAIMQWSRQGIHHTYVQEIESLFNQKYSLEAASKLVARVFSE